MKKNTPFFIFLFFISCLGQISSDLYLPALPTIRDAFLSSEQLIQLTLSVFMLGFSVSHLIYGPISDYVGRKKPLLIGLCICIIGTILCRFSTSIETLIVGRTLQGFGAGAGAALFLSILRDVYDGNALAKISSFLGISRVVLLASAPLIGSYLLHFFDWRACFTFLFIYSVCCLLGSIFILKETNSYLDINSMSIKKIATNMWALCMNPVFISNAFCVMLAFAGIVAWLTTLPFLLQDVVGLTPVEFGWVSALAGLFFIVGGFINAMVVERYGFQKMLMVGLLIMVIASIVMLLFGLVNKINTMVIMLPVMIYIIGSSFIFSNAYAGAMSPFSKIAGTAGALFGFIQILGGAMSSALMSLFKNYNQIPLAIILLCSALLALLIQHFAHKSKLHDDINRHTNKIY